MEGAVDPVAETHDTRAVASRNDGHRFSVEGAPYVRHAVASRPVCGPVRAAGAWADASSARVRSPRWIPALLRCAPRETPHRSSRPPGRDPLPAGAHPHRAATDAS